VEPNAGNKSGECHPKKQKFVLQSGFFKATSIFSRVLALQAYVERMRMRPLLWLQSFVKNRRDLAGIERPQGVFNADYLGRFLGVKTIQHQREQTFQSFAGISH
jgi:hypothetical protein